MTIACPPRAALVVSLLAVPLVGCGSRSHSPAAAQPASGAPAKLPDGPPLVTPREVMSYSLALGGMDLATFDLAVGDVTDVAGRRAIVVQGHAKTRGLAAMLANVDDVYTSWIDVETGRPLRWTVEEASTEGEMREKADAWIARRAEDVVPVHVWLGEQPAVLEPQKVTLPEVWDYNAYLVALRAWEAPAGSRVVSEVFRSRYMWNVTMTAAGEETLVTALGEFPTLRFDGRAYMLRRDGTRAPDPERQFSVWITNDQDRVPVQTTGRTDYGDIKLTILDYQPGNGQRLRP